jgi:hypothetical protein
MELSKLTRAGVLEGSAAPAAAAGTGAGVGRAAGAGAGVGRAGGAGGVAAAGAAATGADTGTGRGRAANAAGWAGADDGAAAELVLSARDIATGPLWPLAALLGVWVGLCAPLEADAAVVASLRLKLAFTAARDLVLMRRLFIRTLPRRAGAPEAVGLVPGPVSAVLSASVVSVIMSAVAATS